MNLSPGGVTYVVPVLRFGLTRALFGMKWMSPRSPCRARIPSELSICYRKVGSYYRHYSKQCRSCWKCTNSVDQYDLFCKTCDAIQKLDPNRNYFDLFGLSERYSVDLKVVQNTFRDLQRLLHPDVFSNKDEEERKLSEEHSSLVNKAYTTLTHPLRRALYMLRLKGLNIEETPNNLSQDFLMDIMERNEEVDGLEDVNKIRHLSQNYRNIMMDLSQEVERAFNKEDFEKAKELAAKMKYFSNLENKLRDLKQKYGILD